MAPAQPARARSASALIPEVWGKIPPRNKNFTGRQTLLVRLQDGIAGKITAVVPHALHGLGGVGKTQMAIEYIYRCQGDYDLVWWIPADQPVLARVTLASLAPHLGLPPPSTTGVEEAAEAVLDSLRRGEPYARWLLVFDNADQPEDIVKMVPQGPGHVLITSRNHRWDSVVETVRVDVFSRSESVEFLEKRVRKAISKKDADRLAHELGDLPLALEQAGALQSETGMSVSEYLRLLRERTSQLLDQGKPTEYPATMTAAWSLSVASLADKTPEAVDLLRCCAFFGPEPIPRDIFSRPHPGLGQQLNSLLGDPIRLSRAIGELGRFALARVDLSGRTLQVHRLIQALVRDELSEQEQARLRNEVHLLLVGAAPDDPDDPQNWRRYNDLLGHISPSRVGESHDPVVRQFALRMVRYLYTSGDYSSARALVEQLLDEWTKETGKDDLETVVGRRYLGNILRALGQYNAAYEVDRAALPIMEDLGGPRHQDTLRLFNSLGADLRARGDFAAALKHDLISLERHEEQYGPGHPDTLRVLNNLGLDYGLNSHYLKGREHHERAYLGFLNYANLSGSSIPGAWTGLARAVRLCGDYSEACDLGEEAYAFAKEQMHAEHPITLLTAKDLSIAWRRYGEYDKAFELAEETHARFVRNFGIDHPDTLAAAMCLSNVQRTMGKLEEANELAADTVRRYPKAYGTDHPFNHGCAGNLALLHRVLGDVEAARQLNEKALAGLEARVGRDHHYTLTVASNLASDLAALGDLEGACRLGQDTMLRLQKVLGETHPMTLLCAANLAIDLLAAGREEQGDRLLSEVKEGYARTLGLEHPDALAALAPQHLDADFDPPPL